MYATVRTVIQLLFFSILYSYNCEMPNCWCAKELVKFGSWSRGTVTGCTLLLVSDTDDIADWIWIDCWSCEIEDEYVFHFCQTAIFVRGCLCTGYAGVVRFGGLRIGGLSGIFKARDYTRGHFEHPPYNEDTKRSCYHIRNVDVFRLKQVKCFDVILRVTRCCEFYGCQC